MQEMHERRFKVIDNGRLYEVKHYDIDRLLKKMDTKKLRQFINDGGRIRACKLDNGDYILRAQVPGNGGEPLCDHPKAILGVGVLASVATAGTVLIAGPAAGLIAGCVLLSACASIAIGVFVVIEDNDSFDV